MLQNHDHRTRGAGALLLILLLVGLAWAIPPGGVRAAEAQKQRAFSSPEEAVRVLMEAVKANNDLILQEIFGPGAEELIASGDPVADQQERIAVWEAFQEAHRLVPERQDKVILQVGKDDWPLPIPIVKEGQIWRFDTMEGQEEILSRRIGKNELSVIQVCLAYVDVQREYATKDRDKDGVLEYAQRFVSSPGKKDGLYWQTKPGESQSPIGPLVAQAVKEGYRKAEDGKQAEGQTLIPYHGYYYKALKAQGKDAPGGAYEYVVKGRMIGGFALVAWPAKYGSSGIMTFMVNHDGVVYEKDLGPKTAAIASGMTRFDPDQSWKKVEPR